MWLAFMCFLWYELFERSFGINLFSVFIFVSRPLIVLVYIIISPLTNKPYKYMLPAWLILNTLYLVLQKADL